MSNNSPIKCAICGAETHVVVKHLNDAHPGWTVEKYQDAYPDEPLLSEKAKEIVSRNRQKNDAGVEAVSKAAVATVVQLAGKPSAHKEFFHDLFQLGKVKAAMNSKGDPIPVTVIDDHGSYAGFVPTVDDAYIFNIDLLKTFMIGMELNMPVLLWGMHGTGKTTIAEQFCAHTRRPAIRVQHTISTEESHVLGQYTVRDGETRYEYGPLAVAMLHGLVYIADEYDFALPSVLSVYQPVLEGKALVIKDAPAEMRIIKPHPNFRFVATGNTNGGGDESGLYQGTQIQNAANYSRFAITVKVDYMPEAQEINVIMSQAKIAKDDAAAIVRFARNVRSSYEGREIGVTVSPRELINAAKLGLVRGCDWKSGLELAFVNRLNKIDGEACRQYMQRIFA